MNFRLIPVSAVIVCLAVAASSSGARAPVAKTAQAPSPVPTSIHYIKGKIEHLNKRSRMLVVHNASGRRDTIAYSEKSSFHYTGDPEIPATKAAMKVGTAVLVLYRVSGKSKFAVNIAATPPAGSSSTRTR